MFQTNLIHRSYDLEWLTDLVILGFQEYIAAQVANPTIWHSDLHNSKYNDQQLTSLAIFDSSAHLNFLLCGTGLPDKNQHLLKSHLSQTNNPLCNFRHTTDLHSAHMWNCKLSKIFKNKLYHTSMEIFKLASLNSLKNLIKIQWQLKDLSSLVQKITKWKRG